MTVTVRPLAIGDKSRWTELFRGYIAFYEAAVPDRQIELTWSRLIAGAPDFHLALIAADDADYPLGLAHVLFHRSTWSPAWYCYLEDLFVDPAARARGIGQKLIQATYAEADRRGATRTYWTTQEFNYRARGLYDKLAGKSVFVQYRR